jgi:6-phosphogluconolactonase
MNMNKAYHLEIFPTGHDLAEAAAKLIIDIATAAIKLRGKFVISLSGGHTPERLFALLATLPYRNQLPWNETYIFWGDERCVPADDVENNARMAKTVLLDRIGIPAENVYPIPVDLAPDKAAREYENIIKHFFAPTPPRFDLILLGLGENGHTASIFPGEEILFEPYLVKEVYVAEQRMFRITMTPELINHALNIIFLVEGGQKADILKTILTAPYQPHNYPAQLINPGNGKLYWLADVKAAALLTAPPDSF